MNSYVTMICFVVFTIISISADAQPSPRALVEKCVQRQGGEENFRKIKNIYIKMDLSSKTEKADVESLVEQYFRFPNKLRAEIQSMMNPPTKISWDGEDAWQQTKDSVEKTTDQKQKERLKESLRFVRLIMLASLLDKDSKLEYKKFVPVKGKNYDLHVVSQISQDGETVTLYVRSDDYSLYGGEFYWKETDSVFKVFFGEQSYWVDGICFPREARIYRDNEKVLEAKVRLAKINKLQNGNSFFSNLNEKAEMQKKKGRQRGRKNN